MIEFRQYQSDIYQRLRTSVSIYKHSALVIPTGGGKTQIGAMMADAARKKGKKIMFTCHRDFLLDQTAEAFGNLEIPYTFIAAGRPYNPYANVIIASIDTLKRRLDKIPRPDVLIVDECVHAAAAGWVKVIEHYQAQGCYTVGLTACPERLSGQGLGKWFKDMVIGPTTAELIEQGYLSKYKAFNPSRPDLSGVHSRAGDYVQAEINQRMDKPSITGDAVKEYTKIANGAQGLMFCCSIQHSQNVADAFRAAGFSAAHIGADTDRFTRASMLRDYRNGQLKILTSVDIFNEGFNVPAASYAGLLRPTRSLSIFLQQCGRVLRAEAGKEYAFIADHANNILHKNGEPHHGFPDDPREWTLEDREKKSREQGEKTIAVRSCPECFFTFRPAPVCPACKFELPIAYREVEQVDGELAEINKEAIAKARRQQQAAARTIDDLRKIAEERGYKPRWIRKMAQLKRITQ